ncbi:MAG: enoyl-CoA hydratase/isomerase family protein [Chloroflexota bacterium]
MKIPSKYGTLRRMTMTSDDKLLYQISDDGIVTITFNRPQAMNALDMESMTRFAALTRALQDDPSIRVVILTGAGHTAFCSGGDLVELSKLTTETEAMAFISLMGDALRRLELLPVPVIAAINGYALGGGGEIALACDMRIADEKARLGFVQIRLALTPGWGAGQRLLRLVGYPKAMDLLLHGHVAHAPELEALRLVNRIVEAGTAYLHTLNFARHIAQRPPEVVRGIKALLRAGIERPYDEALQIERSIFPPLWAADPHIEAVDAFLKRQSEKKNGGA